MKAALFLATRTFRRDIVRTAFLVGIIALVLMMTVIISVTRHNVARLEQFNAKIDNGCWHLAYIAADENVTVELNRHPAVEGASLGYRTTLAAGDDYTLDLTFLEADQFSAFTLPLIEGREPQARGEIVVDDWVLLKYEIDSLPATVTIEGHQFTITGVYWGRARGITSQTITGYGILEKNRELLEQVSLSNAPGRNFAEFTVGSEFVPRYAYIRVNKDQDDLFYNPVADLAEVPGLERFDVEDTFINQEQSPAYNLALIHADEALHRVLRGIDGDMARAQVNLVNTLLMALLFILIAWGMNIVVNNSVRTLGLFAAIGISAKDTRNYILLRALFCIVFALPLGLLLGVAGSRILLGAQMGSYLGSLVFPAGDIIAYVVFLVLAVLGGTAYPAVRASRLTPLDAIGIQAGGGSDTAVQQWQLPLTVVRGRRWFAFLYGVRSYFKQSVGTVGISVLIATLLIMFIFASAEIEADINLWSPRQFYVADYVITLPYLDYSAREFVHDMHPVDDMVKQDLHSIEGVENIYFQHRVINGLIARSVCRAEADNLYLYEWKLPLSVLTEQGQYYLEGGDLVYRREHSGHLMTEGLVGGYGEQELELAKEYLVDGSIDIDKMASEPIVLLPKYIPQVSIDVPVTNLEVGDTITLVESDIVNPPGTDLAVLQEYTFTIGGFLDTAPLPQGSSAEFIGVVHHKQLEQLQTDFKGIMAIYVDDRDGNDSYDELKTIADTYGYNLINNKDGFEKDAFLEQVLAERRMINTIFGVFGLLLLLVMYSLFRSEIAVRKRELAVLSAVGMNRWQIFGVVLSQAVTTGLMGALAGLLVAMVVYFVTPIYTSVFTKAQLIPWRSMALGTMLAVLAPVLASLISMRVFRKITVQDVVQE